MPGAVRGANGVVHINGDHGVINYMIDGSRCRKSSTATSAARSTSTISRSSTSIEGAYPAQYGLRFGSVFNMATRAGPARPGFDGYASFGSYTDAQSQIGYHAPIAGGGGFDIAFSGDQSTRGLDPPNFDSPHNDASSVGQFARFTLPRRRKQLHERHVHQQLQHVSDSERRRQRRTGLDRRQRDPGRHVSSGSVSSSDRRYRTDHVRPGIQGFEDSRFRRSGERLHLRRGPQRRAAAVRQRRQVDRLRGRAHRSERRLWSHDLRLFTCRPADGASITSCRATTVRASGGIRSAAGVSYDLSRVLKYYAITLQPNNFLAPILTPSTPDAPTTVVDNAPNTRQHLPVVHSRQLADEHLWEADYGLRYDFFTIKSTGSRKASAAFSPRLKLTRFFGKRASLYAYIGRFFEPFSLENVSPSGRISAQSPVAADRGAIRSEAGARYAARVRRPHSGRLRRSRLSRLAKECKRPHRRHASRRNAAPSRHQLRARPAIARGAQLRSTASAQRTGLLLGRPRRLAQLRDAKRSCSLRASDLRPATRRRTTSRTGASRAAFCSTIVTAAGFPPTANTAAACPRRSARTTRPGQLQSARPSTDLQRRRRHTRSHRRPR